jgi:hypothetical protein
LFYFNAFSFYLYKTGDLIAFIFHDMSLLVNYTLKGIVWQ